MRILKVQTLLSWIHAVLVFSGIYLIRAAILQMTPQASAECLSGSAVLLLPVVLSWLLVRVTRTLWRYVLGAAAACALLFLAAGLSLSTVLSALIFLLRCQAWILKEEGPSVLEKPRPVHWLFFLLYYLGALALGTYFQLPWILYLFAADLFVCLISWYLRNVEAYIEQKREIANLPVNTIRRVCRMILAMLVAALFLCILPAFLYGREPLTGLAEYFRNMEYEMPQALQEEFLQEDAAEGGLMMELAGDPKKPPAFVMFFLNVLTFLITAGGILLLCFLIYLWWKRMSEQFSREEDEISFLNEEARREAGIRVRRSGREQEQRGSPSQRIRRLYKKTVKRKLSGKPQGWETPQELEQKAALSGTEHAEELHSLYEKARYSREGCTGEEAAGLARLLRSGRKK